MQFSTKLLKDKSIVNSDIYNLISFKLKEKKAHCYNLLDKKVLTLKNLKEAYEHAILIKHNLKEEVNLSALLFNLS